MASFEVKEVHRHPDGAAVIVPVDLSIPCVFVRAEDMKGRDVQPGNFWHQPDEKTE